MGVDSILLTRTVYPAFVHRFIIIKPKEVHAVAPDLKAGTKIILESVEAMNDKWRLGHTKVFFRAGGEIHCHLNVKENSKLFRFFCKKMD